MKEHDEREHTAEAQRTTKSEARSQGVGAAEPGTELPARSYPDESGVADLGVDEPVLTAPRTGTDSDPTGTFAGETRESRRAEDAVRRVLEDGFPATEGTWKEGGRVPSDDAVRPADDSPARVPPRR